jgi:CheY-like chemotaxis protein
MAQTAAFADRNTLSAIENRSPRILIVDDYDANIMIASNYMEYFGYDYDVAKNGKDAVDKAKSNEYLAILMDIQMPEMDGMEATMKIRDMEYNAKRGRQPIIAMTAHLMAADCQACFAAGMDAYLSKPFNPNELQAMLNHFSTMTR